MYFIVSYHEGKYIIIIAMDVPTVCIVENMQYMARQDMNKKPAMGYKSDKFQMSEGFSWKSIDLLFLS